MTHAEATEIRAVIALLKETKEHFRSGRVLEARERLGAMANGVRPTAPRCSNTVDGAHVRADALEHECCLPGGGEHCECHDDEPELIDETACLACGARL